MIHRIQMKGQARKFVLLTTWRSGSTLIRLCLNSHPAVRCHSEIFLKDYPAADGFKAYYEANMWRNLLYHISENHRLRKRSYNFGMKWIIKRFLYSLYYDPTFSAPWADMTTDAWKEYKHRDNLHIEEGVGFQLMYSQLNFYRPLKDWVVGQNVFVIHLIRENVLKLFISRVVAKETGQWQFARAGSRRKIQLDTNTILGELDKIINERKGIGARFQDNRYLKITYEAFLSDQYEESRKIFDFLEIEPSKMEFPKFLKKINPDSLENIIGNYDEISMTLKGSPYEEFL